MTSHSTAIYTPFADGRTVRDIVEHSPALVTEAWCRQLLRQVLQSLEQQYASGAPHRPITPDSIVMLDSGETLLLSPPDAGATPGSEANLAADLYALALVVHYAISAELPPEGPLGPRLYDDYSANLTQTIDRCLGPNQRLRPKSIAELRTMLGFEQEAMAEPAPAAVQAVAATADTAEPAMPEMAGLRAAPVPEERFPEPPAQSQPQPREQEVPAVAAAPLPHPGTDAFSRPAPAATPLKPSSHPAPEAVAPNPSPATQAPAPWARSGLERWAMVAGAAVVLLAAGGALYTHLNQDNAADLVPLSLPPQEQAARGLDASETMVAPASEAASPDGALGATAGEPATAGDPAAAAALPAAGHAAPSPGTAGGARQVDAVVNGTTYKLLIKPWGTVYVNGIDRGVSPPVKRLTLGQGQHTIRIVNPNFPEHVMTVTAGDAENATIEHDFTAQAEGGR